MSKIYYHFTTDKLRDGRSVPAAGEWLIHDGAVVMCESGLHASATPYNALRYAPGPMLHQVELEGIVQTGTDKVVARKRKIITTIDATNLLRAFARKQALSVIHLWACPAIVRQYLETGDESIRSAARNAARNAAESAARNAAESAAWSAARSAAESATWSAVWSATESAAWNAAESAARSAAWSAAWNAAWSAAWNTAESAADEMFDSMVEKAFKK